MFRVVSDTCWEEEQLSFEETLIEAKPVGSGGFLTLDALNRFHSFKRGQQEGTPFPLPSCLQFNSPQCWCPLTVDRVCFAVENRIYISTGSCSDQILMERSCAPYGTICHLVADSKGTRIVALTVDGHALVFDYNSLSLELLVDISVQFSVLHLDSFRLFDGIGVASQSSTGRVILLNLESEEAEEYSFTFNEPLLGVQEECDGIRVITAKDTWMIVRMPEAIKNPPQSPNEDSSVQERVKAVEEASQALLEQSFEEAIQSQMILSFTLQRRLDACKLFSDLQSHFPLTPSQFNQLGKRLLLRLCSRDLHFQAFQLAIGMEWDMSELLTDWSIKVMKRPGHREREITDKIMDKLMTWSPSRATRVDYLRLAEEAIRLQLNSLASRLLQNCPTSREKIELLVKVDAYEEALKAAINSNNCQEITFVLDCLMSRLSLTSFLQLAQISERVKSALYEYCAASQPVLQQILLYQDDRLDDLLTSRLDQLDGDKVLELGKWFKMLRVQRCFEKRTGGSVALLGLSREACVEKLRPLKLASDFEESIK